MKRSFSSDSSTTKPPFTNSSSSANSIASTTSSPSSATSQIPQQHSSIQYVSFQSRDEAVQALYQSSGRPKRLRLTEICVDDGLILLLLVSNLERLLLQNCRFDPICSVKFDPLFRFLVDANSSKSYFTCAVQFNECITQWIICNGCSNPELPEHEHIGSLLFVLPGNIPQQSLLNDITSLVVIPSRSDSMEPLSSQSKQNLKFVLNHCPKLERLLLKDINLNDRIERFLSNSQPNLDSIYMWRCQFVTADPVWSVLCNSMRLICSTHTEKFGGFRFAIRTNGHTIQIVYNNGSSFLMPISLDLVHGSIITLSNDLPNHPSLDNNSILVLLPSKTEPMKSLSPQSKQTLKSLLSLPHPSLKYLLLKGMDFDEDIEKFISLSHPKWNLIYLWNCTFKTSSPIWSALCDSVNLVCSTHEGKFQNFQFSIRANGHITEIVDIVDPLFLTPNSHDLDRGLILSMEQDLPNDLSLNNISLLTLLPSETTHSNRHSPPHSKRTPKFLMNRPCPTLKYFLPLGFNFENNIEDHISISQLKLDWMYIGTCHFKSSDLIWSTVCESIKLINSMHSEKVHSFLFDILINGHTTRVLNDITPSVLMPDSPDLNHGLILSMGQDLPNDLSLNNISLLALLPPETTRSNRQLSPQSKKTPSFLTKCPYPNLKYLLLVNINFDGNLQDVPSISHLKLNLIYLWKCKFKTSDPIWSSLIDSMWALNLAHREQDLSFQFTIRTKGHTTQIVCHNGPSLLMPYSSNLVNGLVLPLGEDIPNGLPLDNLSFLVFIPPEEADSRRSVSPQSKEHLSSIGTGQDSKLQYLFFKGISLDEIEEKYGSMRRLSQKVYDLSNFICLGAINHIRMALS
jgi:hypothetical protein